MRWFILLLFFYFSIVFAFSQKNRSLDQTCFVTQSTNTTQVIKESKAYVLNLSEKDNDIYIGDSLTLSTFIQSLVSKSPQFCILICKGIVDVEKFNTSIKPLQAIMYFTKESNWISEQAIVKAGKNIVVFADSHKDLKNTYSLHEYISEYKASNLSSLEEGYNKFQGKPENDLVLFNADNKSKSVLEQCLEFWNYYGKIPNFLNSTSDITEVVDSINRVNRVKGSLLYEDKKVAGVRIKDANNITRSIFSGHFSLPVNLNSYVSLSPEKQGYTFEPQKFESSSFYVNDDIHFIAKKISWEDRLLLHLPFNKATYSGDRPESNFSAKGNVQFQTDATRSDVVYFDGESNITVEEILPENELPAFSCAIWIKPIGISWQHSLMSSNSFSFRIMNKKLCFTLFGVSDNYSDAPIVKDEWQHIAFSYQPDEWVRFYHNGSIIDSSRVSHPQRIASYLNIAKSERGEYFFGYMDELMVWQRAIDEAEMKTIYNRAAKKRFRYWSLLIGIGVGVLLLLFFFYKRKNKSQEAIDNSKPDSIGFFGEFTLYNTHREEISSDFSPKLRQLFVLLLLYSEENEKGISSKKIAEILWPDSDENNAASNRKKSIKKLKELTSNIQTVTFEYKNKSWKVIISDQVIFDYHIYKTIYKKLGNDLEKKVELDKEQLLHLLNVVGKGSFLPNIEISWLDEVKSAIMDEIIQILIEISSTINVKEETWLSHKLADTLFIYDPVSEEALRLKVQTHHLSGNHSGAKSSYIAFYKRFESMYGEKYSTSYKSVLQNLRLDHPPL